LQEIAAENQVPLIVAPAAANDITGINFNEYTFRTSRENYQDFISLCEYLTTQYDTFIQIAPDYSFGYGGAQSARDACTFFGGEFIGDDIFAPLDTTEFTPYMETILDSGAEAWIVTWAGGGFVPMFQAADELGVMNELGIGASFFDNVTMQAIFGPVIGNTSGILYHYTAPDNAINDFLVEKVLDETGLPPDLFDADGMNAAILAVDALKKTGGDTDAQTLIEAMEGLEFEGPKGTIYIRPEDHVAIQDMYIVTLTNLDDPEFKFYDLVSTNRPNPPCLLPDDMQSRCGDLPIGQLSEASFAEPETGAVTCDEPVKVGFISDLTGGLAIYGTMAQRGFQLGMEYGTGAPGTDNVFQLDDCEIEVLVRDDQGSAETTATLARELIDVDQVDFLVGTVSSGSTASMQEIAAENQVPLIVAPAAANDITGVNFNEYTFRTSRENYQDFISLCEYLTTQYDTFIQIAPDYSFGYGGAQSARDACTFFGGEFIGDDIFAPLDTTDFTPYLETILDSGAEAWIVTWAGGGFVPMFQGAEELGVMESLGIGASFFDNVTMQAIFGPVIGNTSGILYHYTAPDNAINDFLVEKVLAQSGLPPDLFDADGMNAALLLLEALKVTGGDTSPDVLISSMEGLEFEGPKGTIYVRPEDHVAIQDMYIVTLTNLDDPEFKFYDLVTTNRPEPPCLLPEDKQDRCGDLPIGSLSGE
jgi:branched-chain amino acid transport system substrate-binding protein